MDKEQLIQVRNKCLIAIKANEEAVKSLSVLIGDYKLPVIHNEVNYKYTQAVEYKVNTGESINEVVNRLKVDIARFTTLHKMYRNNKTLFDRVSSNNISLSGAITLFRQSATCGGKLYLQSYKNAFDVLMNGVVTSKVIRQIAARHNVTYASLVRLYKIHVLDPVKCASILSGTTDIRSVFQARKEDGWDSLSFCKGVNSEQLGKYIKEFIGLLKTHTQEQAAAKVGDNHNIKASALVRAYKVKQYSEQLFQDVVHKRIALNAAHKQIPKRTHTALKRQYRKGVADFLKTKSRMTEGIISVIGKQ